MDFLINGKRRLSGSIEVSTAKNALLPILAACLLVEGTICLHKVTYFDDINNMLQILQNLGVKVCKYEQMLILDCQNINNYIIPLNLASKLRASIFCLGPLLGRLKKARVAYPGGCQIGTRPINIHLDGLKKLGINVVDRHGYINAFANNFRANKICLPFPSVGATENLIMASVLQKGKVTLQGVAKEPEIVDLCNFLNSVGAKITGAGSDEIIIEGVSKLSSGEYTPIPDRIITGTYLLLPLICGGKIEVCNAKPEHISPILYMLKNNSCNVRVKSDKIIVSCENRPKNFGKIETLPYPHFPTDLQQPLCAVATIAKGTTIITENLFESRFNHVPELIKMGAKIDVLDGSVVVHGVPDLYGAEVEAPDLRGGAALIMAGLGANGYTTVKNIDVVDRGYFKLEQTLNLIGADITRIN
ncbi:MAG: UDP-N-acetylglucosamine 1-carboxyvinyltransferase [Clostridiales bacterium]|nr:UDP-N-acetylglucosamine 1-carboxyvinyltransferase [Clostridiales bacterium]